jgi:hypothetical protein
MNEHFNRNFIKLATLRVVDNKYEPSDTIVLLNMDHIQAISKEKYNDTNFVYWVGIANTHYVISESEFYRLAQEL